MFVKNICKLSYQKIKDVTLFNTDSAVSISPNIWQALPLVLSARNVLEHQKDFTNSGFIYTSKINATLADGVNITDAILLLITLDDGTQIILGNLDIPVLLEEAENVNNSTITATVKSVQGLVKITSAQIIIEPIEYSTIIYYAPVISIPTTEAQILALTAEVATTTANLQTGTTNKIFILAIPATKTLSNAENASANEDILSEYILVNTINVNAIPYKIYAMQMAIPYSVNQTHLLTYA